MFKKLSSLRPGLWLSLIGEGRLAWRLFRDGQVPWHLKLLPIAAVIYVIFPDPFSFIPIIGQIDDITILLGTIAAFVKLAPEERVVFHRDASTTTA